MIVISPLFCSGENASKFLSINSKSSGNGRQANEVELPGDVTDSFPVNQEKCSGAAERSDAVVGKR